MKLLLFSDLHLNSVAANHIASLSIQADAVVGAGDFCTCRKGLDRAIDMLSSISCPIVLVPGNSESADELIQACGGWPNATVLHGNGCVLNEVPFFGIGGGIPVTPFGSWSYDFTEEEAAELLKDCPESGVLISHSPPFGVVDLDSSGRHLGSKSIRETINSRTLDLVVCGHIHASAGKTEFINRTPVVNAGTGGILFEIESSPLKT